MNTARDLPARTIRYPRPNRLGLVKPTPYSETISGRVIEETGPFLVPYYGNPQNTPVNHKWMGYRCPCGRPIRLPSLASFCVECDDI